MSNAPALEVSATESDLLAETEIETAETRLVEAEDDLLVEDVSIDGMCGVY